MQTPLKHAPIMNNSLTNNQLKAHDAIHFPVEWSGTKSQVENTDYILNINWQEMCLLFMLRPLRH